MDKQQEYGQKVEHIEHLVESEAPNFNKEELQDTIIVHKTDK